MNKITQQDIDRLDEIKDEIKELLKESKRIIRKGPTRVWDRASGYWFAHISTALNNNHDYLGSSMVTMEQTIDELSGEVEDEEEDKEEYNDNE